jgi:hypothetical protein
MTNRFDDPSKKTLQKELADMIYERPGTIMESMPEHEA